MCVCQRGGPRSGRLFTTAAAVLTLLVATGLAAPPDSDTKASVGDQITTIHEAYARRRAQFHEELREAAHQDQKVRDANNRFNEDVQQLADRLIDLLKKHGREPAAFDGFVNLVGQMGYYLDPELVAIVIESHLAHPKMAQLCVHLGQRGQEQWPQSILKAVVEKCPESTACGQATLALGDYHRDAIMPWARKMSPKTKERALGKARQYYKQVVEQFADIASADGIGTLGEKATWELTRLDNLDNLQVGKPAPPFVGTDLDGRTVQLADFRGKVTVIVFWGSWCGPCMRLVPHERELHARMKGKPFALLGVNAGDELEKARETVEKHEMDWQHVWDRGGTRTSPIQIAYNVQHWPTIFVLDRSGIIRYIDVHGHELDRAVDELLESEHTND
jgi:peroxiredoxin